MEVNGSVQRADFYLSDLFADVSNPVNDVAQACFSVKNSCVSGASFLAQFGVYNGYKAVNAALLTLGVKKVSVFLEEEKIEKSSLFDQTFQSLSQYLIRLSCEKLEKIQGTPCDALLHLIAKDSKLAEILPIVVHKAAANLVNYTIETKKLNKVELADVILCFLEEFQDDFKKVHASSGGKKELEELSEKLFLRLFPKGASEIPLVDVFGFGTDLLKSTLIPLWVNSLYHLVIDLNGNERSRELKALPDGETLYLIAKRAGELFGKELAPSFLSNLRSQIGELLVDFFEPGKKDDDLSYYLASQVNIIATTNTDLTSNLFSFTSDMLKRLLIDAMFSLANGSQNPAPRQFINKIKEALKTPDGQGVVAALLKDIPCGEGHLLTLAPALKQRIIPEFIESYKGDVTTPLSKVGALKYMPIAKALAGYLKTLLKSPDKSLATTLVHLFSQEFKANHVEALLNGIDLDDPFVEEYFQKAIASLIDQVIEGLKPKSLTLMLEEIVDAYLSDGKGGVISKIKEVFEKASLQPSHLPLPSPQLQKLAFEAMRDQVIPDFLERELQTRAPLLKQICLRFNWKEATSFKALVGNEGRFLFNEFDELIREYKTPKQLSVWLGLSEEVLTEVLCDPFYEKLLNKTIEEFFYYSLSHMLEKEQQSPLLLSLFKKITDFFNHSSDKEAIYNEIVGWMGLEELLKTNELSAFAALCHSFYERAYIAFSGNPKEYHLAREAFVLLLEDKNAVIPLPANATVEAIDKAREEYLNKRRQLTDRIEKPLGVFATKIVNGALNDWLKGYQGQQEAKNFLKELSPASQEVYQKNFFSWIADEIKKTLFVGCLGLAETVKNTRTFKLETLPSQMIDWVLLCWDKHQKNISFEMIYKMKDIQDPGLLEKERLKVNKQLSPFCKELLDAAFKNHMKALPFPEEFTQSIFKQLETEILPSLITEHIQSLHGNLEDKKEHQAHLRNLFSTNYMNELARVLGIYGRQALQNYLKSQVKLILKEIPEEFSIKIDDSLPGFNLAWQFIEDRMETSLLQALLGFSKAIENKEGSGKEKGQFLKELLKEFLTISYGHFKAFNDVTVSQKKKSASQIPQKLFLESLKKKGITHLAKDRADALETLLRQNLSNPKIEYFQLPHHIYLEKHTSFCSHFEDTPPSGDGKFKQWKLKNKSSSEAVCREAASLALTEEFFVPLTEKLLKMSGCDDLTIFPGQKEVGETTYQFLKDSVLPGLLKSIFDALMDPATLLKLMENSLTLIKNVGCEAEQEQIKENFKAFKTVIDLMSEAVEKENDSKFIERQLAALEICQTKFRAVNHALPGNIVFIHLETVADRAKLFLEALKEPQKIDEINSAKTALTIALSDAKEKLYATPGTDDEASVKEFNETCGQLVLEIISFIPHVLTKPLLNTEDIQQFSKEAIGKAILKTLNEQSWTVLKGMDKLATNVLTSIHEGKFEGEPHTAEFKPSNNKYDFYSGSPTDAEKAKSTAARQKKVVNDLAKTVYDQVIHTISRSFKFHWGRFQKMIDSFIERKFGDHALKIKEYLDKQFQLVVVKGFGAFLFFFFYHLFLPIFWLIDLYNKAQGRDFIKNGGHEGHKHLVLNLIDQFFRRVATI